jgi:2-polyprenyl-3-methyl-5-hydroxy-6-metoxy-1,4-benzoquinol methylase
MQYDPIKKTLGSVFNKNPWLRILFYHLLDLLLLRTWHVKVAIRKWAKGIGGHVSILDAGSGFGQYSYYLARKNKSWTITGVDVKEEQVTDCNGFFSKMGMSNAAFSVGDLTIFRKDEIFDLILSVDVMEHILEDVEVFKNFHASLKPGGMVLISTPSDQGGSDVHDQDHESFIDEHVRDGYNISEIQEKLKQAGFKKTEAKYNYSSPGKVSWRLSMKYPIVMLNVTKLFFIVLPIYYLVTFPFSLILNFLDVHITHTSGTGLIVKAWKE